MGLFSRPVCDWGRFVSGSLKQRLLRKKPFPSTWPTCCVNHLYSSSAESSMSPSLTAPSLHCVISVEYSSPSNRPGTSPLASSVFMRSRKLESSTFDSSIMKQIFSSCCTKRLCSGHALDTFLKLLQHQWSQGTTMSSKFLMTEQNCMPSRRFAFHGLYTAMVKCIICALDTSTKQKQGSTVTYGNKIPQNSSSHPRHRKVTSKSFKRKAHVRTSRNSPSVKCVLSEYSVILEKGIRS